MAKPQQAWNTSTRYRKLGRFVRRAVKVGLIVLLAFQPGFAGGSGSGGKGGGKSGKGGCGGGSGSGGSPPPGTPPGAVPANAGAYVAPQVAQTYAGVSGPPTIAPGVYNQALNGEDYIAKLLVDSGGEFDARLPGYSYFQGVLQAQNHISLVGQVRVVGAVVGADAVDATANFYSGAMVTTNAHGVLGADGLTPTGGMRTRIMEMEEIKEP